MSSYNNVTKIRYTGNLSDLVSLNEYIVFQDDKAKKKYIVFKFTNNVTQQLLGMEFEVCQYNVENNLIEKSVVIYNKFLAGAEEEFVPKAKLRVSYHCATISVRLIKAAFDRFVWNEGEYEDNSYKFDHFFHDEKTLEESEEDGGNVKRAKREKGEKKKHAKREKREKKKRSKRPFVMKDATKRNLSVFPSVFNAIACVLIIGFAVGSVLIFKNETKQFTEGDFNYRIVQTGEIAVCGYNGSATAITVPQRVGTYYVTKVDGGAFRNSKITSITFRRGDTDQKKLLFDANAFVNCDRLTTVTAASAVEFKDGAFVDCDLLVAGGFVIEGTVPETALVDCGKGR